MKNESLQRKEVCMNKLGKSIFVVRRMIKIFTHMISRMEKLSN